MSLLSRRLLAIWVRAIFTVTILLALPVLYPRFVRAVDPQRERREMAQALERQQRAGGERTVLPSGEIRHAIVFTPASPSERSDANQLRGLVWWARLLALVVLLGASRRTYLLVKGSRATAGTAGD
jgi:hypothetical protein